MTPQQPGTRCTVHGARLLLFLSAPVLTAQSPPLALTGATLIDGTGAVAVPDAVVVLDGRRITCAGPRAACPVPQGARVTDVRGKWIIPGLVDAHVHFGQTGWVDGRPDALDLRGQGFPYERVAADLAANPETLFRSYLCSGITSVFDVGGFPWTWSLQRRSWTNPDAPAVSAAGPLLSTVDFRMLDLPGHEQMIHLSDDSTARRTVRSHAAWGAAAMKVWYIMPPQPPDTARISALVHTVGAEARAAGIPLIVHATGLWQAKDALKAGATLLVHSVTSEPVDDEFIALAKEARASYTPTLVVPNGYLQVASRRFDRNRQPLDCVDPATRAKALATDTVALDRRPPVDQVTRRLSNADRSYRTALTNLKRVHDAGIPVVLGTDAGNPLTLHGASVFMELEAMQEAGLSPMDVLVAATRNGATVLGLAEHTGTVKAGSIADLVVLDADPLADIANVRRISLVVREGKVHERRQLEWHSLTR